MEEKAEKYVQEQFIDYGDLSHQAEQQIKKAFIDGMKAQKILSEREHQPKR